MTQPDYPVPGEIYTDADGIDMSPAWRDEVIALRSAMRAMIADVANSDELQQVLSESETRLPWSQA